jgi:hypothetical protein
MKGAKHSFSFDWRGLAGVAIVAVLILSIGPLTLISALLLQAWCARSLFDAKDRWDSIRTFTWFFTVLFALAVAAFFARPGPALHIWQASPLARVLGTPDLLGNLTLRWVGCLPLSFALALVLEKGNPRTIQWFFRVQTAGEQAHLAAARRRAEEQAAQQRAEEQARLERERAEEMAKLERAAARRAAARRRAAAALTAELAPAPEKREKTTRETSTPTLWEQATPPPAAPPDPPPAAKKPKPDKPDLGDGSMDALL